MQESVEGANEIRRLGGVGYVCAAGYRFVDGDVGERQQRGRSVACQRLLSEPGDDRAGFSRPGARFDQPSGF
jgi:hypothetical protein